MPIQILPPSYAQTPLYLSFSIPGTFFELIPSPFDGNYEILNITLPTDVAFPPQLYSSEPFTCLIAPVADVILVLQSIQGNTIAPIGEIIFLAATKIAAVSFAGITLSAGTRLRLIAPSVVDTTIAGVSGTIAGLRQT